MLVSCNSSDPSQLFTFDNATGTLSMSPAGSGPLCVDAGSTASCDMAPFNTYPYCNYSLATADRAADLASRLTLLDWANLLYHWNQGNADVVCLSTFK